MTIKEVNLGLAVPPIETAATPASPGSRDRSGAESDFSRTLSQNLAPSQNADETRRQARMVGQLAQMELMNLNGLLLGALTNNGEPSTPMGLGGLGGGTGGLGGPMMVLMQVLANLQAAQGQNPGVDPKTVVQKKESNSEEEPTEPTAAEEAGTMDPAGQPPEEKSQFRAWLDEVIDKTANTFAVDPSLVRAVIQTESGFNPKATSPAGAMGLMQLMPGTARDLGVSQPYDPVENMVGGIRYLKLMLDKYGGDVSSALAAYNWGPGNLDRNLNTGRMPEETRNYVRIVSDLYRRFRQQEEG